MSENNKRNTVEVLNNLKTVSENKKGFRKHQYKRASVTRKLHHMVGETTFRNLKTTISQNTIQNCPVKVDHIVIKENIFGPVSTLHRSEERRGMG